MKLVTLADLAEQPVSHNPAIRKRVLVEPGELPGLVQFAVARFGPGMSASTHTHADLYEVFLVQAGRATFLVNGTAYEVCVGGCVTIAPGESHEVINSGNEELVVTYFSVKA